VATVAILGAGAWGTAVAIHLAERAAAKPAVTLWTRDEGQARAIAAARVNARYLPGIALPSSLVITSDLRAAARADLLVAATPVAALPGLVQELVAHRAGAPLVWLSKGFVAAPALPAGVGLAHQVITPLWPAPVGIVSGPTFAEEVARGLPAALTVAATGRLSAALGGKRETLMGLAGLGDLVLTCTGDLSRNRRVGLALAQGKRLPAILAELGHVAEGVTAAIAARALAAHHGVEMPICEIVYRVLYEDLPARVAVEELLRREPRSERQ